MTAWWPLGVALLGPAAPAEGATDGDVEGEVDVETVAPESPGADHYGAAVAAFEAGDLALAATLFQRAYEAGGSVAVLYDWAQVLRLGGDCRAAAEQYQRFVDEGGEAPPVGEQIDAATWSSMRANATQQIAECPEPESVAPVVVAEPVAPVQPDPQPEPPPEALEDDAADNDDPMPTADAAPRRRVDPLGVALLTVGGAAAATGVGLFIGADVVQSEAEDAFVHQTQTDGLQQARALQTAGFVVLPVGVALAVVGAIRLGLVAKKRKRRRVAVAPLPAGIVIRARF